MMPPPIQPSEVHYNSELRNLFAALALARPDLNEALQLIAVALGLQSESSARWNGAGQQQPPPRTIDTSWSRR